MAIQPADDVSKYLSCIQCGICTSSCPTYLELGSEADSPRGRIHLMRSVAEGRLDFTPDVVHHLDLCLDCQACVTACPSGVEYGSLIEEARVEIEDKKLRPLRDRILIKMLRDWLFPYPRRMKAAMLPLRLANRIPGFVPLLQRLPWGIGKMVQLVPTQWLRGESTPPDEETLSKQMNEGFVPAMGKSKGRVALLTGCVGSLLFADVNRATAYVLARNGYDVIIPPQQGCCGSLHLHTGAADTTRSFAHDLMNAFAAECEPSDHLFESVSAIIVNAAGCGSAMKQYGEVFPGDTRAKAFASRVRDITEFLAACDLEPMGPLNAKVTYHDACHLLHGQGVAAQPRALLNRIPGLTLVPLEESGTCCGSAGIYNIIHQKMGEQLSERKIAHIRATSATIVATGNSGCSMQIVSGAQAAGLDIEVLHPVQLMYRAYRALDTSEIEAATH